MLTFFERSPLDQVLRNDKVHRIQPCCQSPIKISGADLRASCDIELLLTSRCRADFIADLTLWTFRRNHAVQWILPGQHRNHCIWSQSPWRKRETLLHWLSGTHVSMKTTPHYFSLSRPSLCWPLIRKIIAQMALLVSAKIFHSLLLNSHEVVRSPWMWGGTHRPHRKFVCAPLPSLGVCRKQKEEHIPLGTSHKTRKDVTSVATTASKTAHLWFLN